MSLLHIEDLHVEINHLGRTLHVLNGVDLTLQPGEMVGLVGETGSGKTMTIMTILRMLARGARVTRGRIRFGDRDLLAMDPRELQKVRGREIGIVFQHPRASLNPTRRIVDQIADRYQDVLGLSRRAALAEAGELLHRIGIPEPRTRGRAYPHELSGGMCQRVMVGMGIAAGPKLLLADEPTTGLDVTLQLQIMELIRDLARSTGAAVLLITHDVALVSETCERVAVMYGGRVMEEGAVDAVLRRPKHPYTKSLVDAVRSLEEGVRPGAIPGTVPRFTTAPTWCPFADRCAEAVEACRTRRPDVSYPDPDRRLECHLYQEGDA